MTKLATGLTCKQSLKFSINMSAYIIQYCIDFGEYRLIFTFETCGYQVETEGRDLISTCRKCKYQTIFYKNDVIIFIFRSLVNVISTRNSSSTIVCMGLCLPRLWKGIVMSSLTSCPKGDHSHSSCPAGKKPNGLNVLGRHRCVCL